MTQRASFGDPERFALALRWVDDDEPRERHPAGSGWSCGELRLTVGGHVLTAHHVRGEAREAVCWYLLPFLEWLARSWVSLLHEERFSWPENRPLPAATAVFLALRREISESNPNDDAVRNWWLRHALRAADSSALYPDLVFRRFGDSIELSWTARQPAFSPDGFQFSLTPGVALLPVADVAGPLWEALAWAVSTAQERVSDERDRQSITRLAALIDALTGLETASLEAGYLPARLLSPIRGWRSAGQTDSERLADVPALAHLDDEVMMFGGVAPDLDLPDVTTLHDFMVRHKGGQDGLRLASFMDEMIGAPIAAPHEEGYDLAEDFLEALDLPGNQSFIDVAAIFDNLGITIEEQSLNTLSIRGVALAGKAYAPATLINLTSSYNQSGAGKRFTLAHELFHILYDRRHAKGIAHTSGPWAQPGIEKRANAFAAMFLMPRALVARLTGGRYTAFTVGQAARTMGVGVSALVEHLYNLNAIDDGEREALRRAFSHN